MVSEPDLETMRLNKPAMKPKTDCTKKLGPCTILASSVAAFSQNNRYVLISSTSTHAKRTDDQELSVQVSDDANT
jgi:hypothetical protein